MNGEASRHFSAIGGRKDLAYTVIMFVSLYRPGIKVCPMSLRMKSHTAGLAIWLPTKTLSTFG